MVQLIAKSPVRDDKSINTCNEHDRGIEIWVEDGMFASGVAVTAGVFVSVGVEVLVGGIVTSDECRSVLMAPDRSLYWA